MVQKKNENGWGEKKALIIYQLQQLNEGYDKLDTTVENLSGKIVSLQHKMEQIEEELQRRVTTRSTKVAIIASGIMSLVVMFTYDYIKSQIG